LEMIKQADNQLRRANWLNHGMEVASVEDLDRPYLSFHESIRLVLQSCPAPRRRPA
jgi:hypothetical protein